MTLNDLFAEQAIKLGFKDTPAPPTPRASRGVLHIEDARARKWLEAKLAAKVDDLATMGPRSGRNAALNASAYDLGHYVPKWLDEQDVIDALLSAAHTNGVLAEDGERQCLLSIRSGLTAGGKEPKDPSAGGDDLSTLVIGGAPTIRVAATNSGAPNAQDADPDAEVERTSWWPVDLSGLIAGDIPPEAPAAFLTREDGQRLFYAGKVNGLIGESESGKTWVALLAVAQALTEGHPVLYLDFEDTAAGILARLRLMGTSDADLARLAYISPDETFGILAHRDLTEHVAATLPRLVVLDGYNAAMTMMGLNLIDNADIYRFALAILRPLKRTGAAVVTIDHVTKSKEGRGAFAIGGQAKRSDVDGCSISVEVVQAFGKGMAGKLRLTVSKDRPGLVRAVSGGAKNAGLAHIDSTGPTTRVWIDGPDLRPVEERGPFRPTGLMQKVSRYLETCPEGASGRDVATAIGGKAEYVRTALATLVDEGFVATAEGAKRAVIHRFVRAYREDQDLSASVRPECVPSASPDALAADPPVRPRVPPSMGDAGRTESAGSQEPLNKPLVRPAVDTRTGELLSDPDDDPEDWWKK